MNEKKWNDLKSQVREAEPVLARLLELEYENSRLQRLVAELLMKNQQLRATA